MSKVRQNLVTDCPYCDGFVQGHWCEDCGKVHEFGHSTQCPLFTHRPDVSDWGAMFWSDPPMREGYTRED